MADDPLDIEALARSLRKRRRVLGLGLREAARQAEVPPTTFSRVEDGRLPDLATYQRLVGWLGVSSDAFMQTRRVRLDSTPEIIAEHLIQTRIYPRPRPRGSPSWSLSSITCS